MKFYFYILYSFKKLVDKIFIILSIIKMYEHWLIENS